MKILVNGETFEVEASHISYREVVRLAGKSGHPSVTYHQPRQGGGGLMSPGSKPVPLTEGLSFSVYHTDSA